MGWTLLAILGAALILPACTARDVGQTLYNTGKAACENGSGPCGGSSHRHPQGPR